MDSSSIPHTDRRFYQPITLSDDWMTRNDIGTTFYPTGLSTSSHLNTFYNNEGIPYLSQTISAVQTKPTLHFNSNHIQNNFASP